MIDAGFRLSICSECGKHFVPAPEHRYKKSGHIFCSWHCINAYNKRVEENNRAKMQAINERRREQRLLQHKLYREKQAKKKAVKDKIAEFECDTPPNRSGASKPVLQFTKDGEFIARYESIGKAASAVGVTPSSITRCCRDQYRNTTAGGYMFKYDEKKGTKNDCNNEN